LLPRKVPYNFQFYKLGGYSFVKGTKEQVLAITLWTEFLIIFDDIFETLTPDLQTEAISFLQNVMGDYQMNDLLSGFRL
jgi:hypothetical protein